MTLPAGDPGADARGHADGGSSERVPPPAPAGYPPGYGDPNTIGPTYGEPYPTGAAPGQRPKAKTTTNTMAIASLVTSVVGFAPYFGGILSIVGIVLGAVALNQIKETPQDGYGLAVAGIVVGIATMVIGLIWTMFAVR